MSKSSSKKILIAPRHCEENHIHKSAGETLISHYLFTHTDFLPIMASLDKGINSRVKALHLAEKYIEISDALILLGGNDIDPQSYNQTNINCKKTYIFRDYFEMALIEKALAKGIPIFGICRGFQMLNIYFGGTLLQHLDEQKYIRHSYSETQLEFEQINATEQKPLHHSIEFIQDSTISQAMGKSKIDTNSFHHQGIDKLGESLKIEATSSDGLVEIISNFDHKIIATQFHPELDLENNIDYRKIFELWLSLIN